jgi:Pyruvate/2-oxoacid:ferredoxin oxidoreductase delta subunit
MGDIGPEARLFIYRPNGKLARHEVFADPRVCVDIHRGAVIENLTEKPKDVSGWRTHEFFIDTKGCLGDECGRCAIVCPESAIHLRGKGKGSFHEIDPLACKGCYICWVECVRTAADCILVDGKTFDPGMRAKHFGE